MGIERRAPKDAVGCVLTHSIKLSGKVFKKGTVLSPDLVSELIDYRLETVSVLTPSTTDCHEDLAAERITERLKLKKNGGNSLFYVYLIYEPQQLALGTFPMRQKLLRRYVNMHRGLLLLPLKSL